MGNIGDRSIYYFKRKLKMGKRKFEIEIQASAVIELDDRVIDVVDDEWRSQLYDLYTPEDIAKHIAYNLLVNKWELSTLDGWTDQPDENAKVIDSPDWFISAVEEILED